MVIVRPDGSTFDANGRGFVSAGGDISKALAAADTGKAEDVENSEKAVAAEATQAEPVGQAAVLAQHFPDGIVDAEGNPVSMDALKGKVVGIYFSAHWCGPCRAFTPKLVEHRNLYKDNFEVVFVSSDRSAEDQKKYMAEAKMPWPTLAFRSEAGKALSKKYSVRGIPALVLLGADGKFISRDGRSLVTQETDMSKLQAGNFKLEKEEYKCGRCDKTHVREKLVIQ